MTTSEQWDFNTRDRIQKVAQILCDPLRLTYWAMENNLSAVEAQRKLRLMALPYWSPDLVQADQDREMAEDSNPCTTGGDQTSFSDSEMIFNRDEDIVL